MSTGRHDEDPGSPKRRCRSWSLEEKRRIVDERLDGGASIAEVAPATTSTPTNSSLGVVS
jgi:hypothetical protein